MYFTDFRANIQKLMSKITSWPASAKAAATSFCWKLKNQFNDMRKTHQPTDSIQVKTNQAYSSKETLVTELWE